MKRPVSYTHLDVYKRQVDTPIDAVRIEDQSLRGAIARDITVTEGAAGRLVTIKTRCTTTGAANSPPLNVGVDMLDLVR